MMDDAGLGSGATHVERDGVPEPDAVAQRLGADDAGRGPGLQHPDAGRLRLRDVEQTAVRLHDQEVAGEAGGLEVVAHFAEIGRTRGPT